MTPHPNAEAIRRGFTAFMKGDLDSARRLFTPDVVWHVAGRGVLSGEFRGFDAIAGWGAKLAELSGGTFREQLVDLVADDDWAFQLVTFQAERWGRKIEDRSVNVYRMMGGRIAECWVLFGSERGFDEFWS